MAWSFPARVRHNGVVVTFDSTHCLCRHEIILGPTKDRVQDQTTRQGGTFGLDQMAPLLVGRFLSRPLPPSKEPHGTVGR